MRHTQRAQLGVALAALLFCLTSSVSGLSRVRAITLAEPARTLVSTSHSHLAADERIELFNRIGQKTPDAVVERRDGPDFEQLIQAVASASYVKDATGRPVHELQFFRAGGQADRRLFVTDSGFLYDPESKAYFRTDASVLGFVASRLEDHFYRR